MLLTETEAKKKWCPHVRAAISHEDNNACNAGVEGSRVPSYSCCVGSGCMMWRWAEDIPRRRWVNTANGNDMTDPGSPPNVPESWEFCPADDEDSCWVEPQGEATARRRGYCGLAGRPNIM